MEIENVLRIEDRGYVYYLGCLEPKNIIELTFIPCEGHVPELSGTLNLRTQDGYQREGDIRRMKEIKSLYANNSDSLIPPVLLSTRGNWRFKPGRGSANFGTLEAQDCAAVIDGQHRLGGLSMMASDESLSAIDKYRKIPFMAVDLDSVEKEKTQFEVINNEQKGIPKSHMRFINRVGSFPGKCAEAMKESDESVFNGRIAVSKSKDWEIITFGAAEDLVAATFDAFFCQNCFSPNETSETQSRGIRILLKYWRTVSECFPVFWSDIEKLPPVRAPKSKEFPGRNKFQYRLLEETGLRAFAKLGSKALNSAYLRDSGDVAWATLEDYLRAIAHDPKFNLAFQKKNSENKDALIALDPELQFQGKSGVNALWRVLEGAFERARNR